jgi:hypothetical protein
MCVNPINEILSDVGRTRAHLEIIQDGQKQSKSLILFLLALTLLNSAILLSWFFER